MSSNLIRSTFWMASLFAVRLLHGGENIEAITSAGKIIDVHWDRRFYDGTAGYNGFIKWYHNPANIRAGFNATTFQNAVQAGFDSWNAADSAFGINPLVPIGSFQGATAATDAAAVDGINAIVWYAGSPSGTLASAPCSFLISAGTTQNGGSGNTVLPIGGGMTIPFPGPIGATYPAGTIIDCGIRFDNQDNWVFGAVAGGIDVQSVATHEEGHFLGLSHSTVGGAAPAVPNIATMAAFAFSNNTDFRSLHGDDIASAVRTYSRANGLSQTTGGRGRIIGTLKKNAGCSANATGVSVRAYLASQGLHGANAVETFSGSQFRQGLAGEPFNGSFELNVQPGGPYTIYAHTFESGGSGFYLAGRYNDTASNSNSLDGAGASLAFDNLASVASIAAGQTVDLGTVGILGCTANQPPTAVSATPSSGSGSSQTFAFLFSDANGANDLRSVEVMFNTTANSANNSCFVHVASSVAYLRTDNGASWLGPVGVGYGSTSVENSQCRINAPSSSIVNSGNNRTVNLSIAFKAPFAGAKNIYMRTTDLAGLSTGWQSRGTWTVVAPANQPPLAVSVTPSSGTGLTRTFAFLYSDPNGASDLPWVEMIVNSAVNSANSCFVHVASSVAYLRTDNGAAWLGPVGVGYGSSTVENAQCRINAPSSSIVSSGNNRTVNLSITFKSPPFAGAKNIYLLTNDLGGLSTGWQQRGTWTVP